MILIMCERLLHFRPECNIPGMWECDEMKLRFYPPEDQATNSNNNSRAFAGIRIKALPLALVGVAAEISAAVAGARLVAAPTWPLRKKKKKTCHTHVAEISIDHMQQRATGRSRGNKSEQATKAPGGGSGKEEERGEGQAGGRREGGRERGREEKAAVERAT